MLWRCFSGSAWTPSRSVRRPTLPLGRLIAPPKAALLLGAEGPGLPGALLERACAVAIPMAAGLDSLNVATASGIALHHLAFSGH